MRIPQAHGPLAGIPPARGRLGDLAYLAALIRNPLTALPREAYESRTYARDLFGTRILFVMDPALLKELLVDNADAVVKTETVRRALRPALGESILSSEGPLWRWQRRATAPMFRHENLLGFVPVIAAHAERTAAAWRARPGTPIDVFDEMTATTYEIIVETMMPGKDRVDIARVQRSMTDFLDSVGWVSALTALGLPARTPYPGRGRAMRAARYLRQTLDSLVSAWRREKRASDDLVTRLIAARDAGSGRGMTDGEIADNILAFAGAGHETTAAALTWTFYLLHHHPQAEARLREEVERVLGDAPFTAAHLDGLVYTRQVLQEAMRLYPPVPLIDRRTTRDVTLGGETVRANTIVLVPIYAIHRHTGLWPEPEAFDPDRFRPEAVKAMPRLAYLPFGAGPRICMGMNLAMIEMITILAILVRSARLSLRPGFSPTLKARISLRPREGMPMTIVPQAQQPPA